MDDQTPQSLTTEETDATERKDGVDLLPGHSTRIPTSRLLSELQHLADEKGRAPTMREMNEEGTYSAKTFCNRFGSWTNSLGELELEPSSAGSEIQICKQDIKESIRELADRLGHVPTVVEMKSHGSYSPKMAQARYGSWNNAIRAAGFDPNHEPHISDERLLDEIHRLAEKLGHPPSTNDLKRDGKFTHRPYFRRFDDWESALHAAGYEPRGWPSGSDSPRWNGGGTSNYYGSNWGTQRYRTLQRDNFRCQMPGFEMTREEHYEQYENDPHIHHIVPISAFMASDDPDYEAMNHVDNLVTLCVIHHRFWEQLSPLRPDIRE